MHYHIMLEKVAYAYESVGTMLGLDSEWKRGLFGALAGFGGQLIIKPKISYRQDGTAKSFGSETLFPWWGWPAAIGIVLGLFF